MRNATIKEMMEALQHKLPEVDEHFIKIMLFNKLSQISTNMRNTIQWMDGTKVPTNFYAFNLATSGYSKGKINNILEDELTNRFKAKFLTTFSASQIDTKLTMRSQALAAQNGIDEAEAHAEIIRRWNKLPKHLYSFSEATIEGFRAKREKLSMVEFGATNFEVDEIALKFDSISEIFSVLLEAYDMGKAKQKLIKVDSNQDAGKVPSNCLMFGTPSRLLNGSKTEKQFIDLLSQGFARRSFFCYINESAGHTAVSSEDRLKMMRDTGKSTDMKALAEHLEELASTQHFNTDIIIPDVVAIALLDYEKACKELASGYKQHQDIEKAEIEHRYWKTLKVMGMMVFIDKRTEATLSDLEDAIEFTDRSGDDFKEIMHRPANYVRLYEFIIDSKRRLTQTELLEELYFYNGVNKTMRDEMMKLAQSYAYTEGGLIRVAYRDGVEFIEGQQTEKNNLEEIIFSVSTDLAHNYAPKVNKWSEMPRLLSSGLNFTTHHFQEQHRLNDNAIQGFNMIVLDVDEDTPLALAIALLEDYEYVIGTTKSHQKDKGGLVADRYRILLPLDRTIKLNKEDYSEFMKNIFDWIPVACDEGTKDIARKWATYEGSQVFVNHGEMICPLEFIPATSKQQARAERVKELGNLNALEKWFALNSSVGDRNNKMLNYALVLKDGGKSYDEVTDAVFALNDKLYDRLPEQELMETVFKTLRRKYAEEE